MLSPYLSSHAPTCLIRFACSGAISPVGIGPTFNSTLPSPPAQPINIAITVSNDFTPSFVSAPRPLVAVRDGHARFPGMLDVEAADELFRRVIIGVRADALRVAAAGLPGSPKSSRLSMMICGCNFLIMAYVAF